MIGQTFITIVWLVPSYCHSADYNHATCETLHLVNQCIQKCTNVICLSIYACLLVCLQLVHCIRGTLTDRCDNLRKCYKVTTGTSYGYSLLETTFRWSWLSFLPFSHYLDPPSCISFMRNRTWHIQTVADGSFWQIVLRCNQIGWLTQPHSIRHGGQPYNVYLLTLYEFPDETGEWNSSPPFFSSIHLHHSVISAPIHPVWSRHSDCSAVSFRFHICANPVKVWSPNR